MSQYKNTFLALSFVLVVEKSALMNVVELPKEVAQTQELQRAEAGDEVAYPTTPEHLEELKLEEQREDLIQKLREEARDDLSHLSDELTQETNKERAAQAEEVKRKNDAAVAELKATHEKQQAETIDQMKTIRDQYEASHKDDLPEIQARNAEKFDYAAKAALDELLAKQAAEMERLQALEQQELQRI